mmetsp:Transcript_91191/g.266948  ORF Transcript_91191/g.266948 Transcript_91191/m.266948 type:complete len:242 (-) Transcript_91191:44-769(-)
MLAGQRALVTGAGRGIGRAVALCYARENARLMLAARSVEQLNEVAVECRAAGAPEVCIADCDLSTRAGVDALVQQTLQDGPIHILVNNAGAAVEGNATVGDPNEWDRMMFLNLNGPMRLTRSLVPSMVTTGYGVVINIGSIAGVEGMSGTSAAYAAAKHGLRGWSTSIYHSLRNSNVKVCLVSPAFVNTPLVAHHENVIPERMIQPNDLAEVCLLPFRMSAACVPVEVTLRLTRSAFRSAL